MYAASYYSLVVLTDFDVGPEDEQGVAAEEVLAFVGLTLR